jgi:hypothetical protein
VVAGALGHADQPPALGRRQRPGLLDEDGVADAGVVVLVVGLEFVVKRMTRL